MARFISSFSFFSFLFSAFFFSTYFSDTDYCSKRVSYIYCLNSSVPSKWTNNNWVVMDGWQMRVFLVKKNANSFTFYCGFYSTERYNSYVFSVVTGGGRIVWSANKDRPVGHSAVVDLTEQGLELRDSDGSNVWKSNTSGSSVVGMYLGQGGTLVLFNNKSDTIWESPVNNVTLTAPSPPEAPATFDTDKPANLPPKGKTNLKAIIAGSTAGGLIIVCILILVFRVIIQESRTEDDREDNIKQVLGMPVRFSYEDLRSATEDFKEKLGGGGFGSVFKGVLADGTEIAVKRLDRMSQGKREFLAEVETIGNLHHFNLVRLIGFCAEKSSRLLVYEYMINGSLDNWIFYRDQRPFLDWQTRKKIILDIAKGLAYLHEECRQTIIHLDIKPQNILLDQHFNAKVSDFGLSKLINRDESHVLTTMRGTPGYLAPEWNQLRITVKVDIYSFGIVLLEVVSARRNFDRFRSESSAHLLRLLQEKAKEDRLIDIVEILDEDVLNHREEIERMIRIGAWCLQDDHTRRPLMSTVVKVLEGAMEVDPNIKYRFIHAMPSQSLVSNHVSTAPEASVLSNPR